MYIYAKINDKKLWFSTARIYILAKRRNPDIKLVSASKSQHFKCVDHKAIYESLRKVESKKLGNYYADQDGFIVFKAFVLHLNHERGFLAGFYLDDSDCYTVDYSCVWDSDDMYGAINEANRLALRAAEEEQEYQIEQRAHEIIEELKNDLKIERADTLAALKGAPRKAKKKLIDHWLQWKADKHQGIKELTIAPYLADNWR